MLELVEQFASHKRIPSMASYQALVRCLQEQCDVTEGKVDVRKKTSGRALQNPSDPDATLDGHKGKGYQAQIAETCNPRNAVQMITAVIPETAADEDGDALQKVAGWNILRASAALARQARKPRKQGNRPPQGPLGLIRFAFRTFLAALANPLPAWPCHFFLPARQPVTG